MQAEPPWNIAGIPPEARDAARAAARREGLSMGEWLTRRITLEQGVSTRDALLSGAQFLFGDEKIAPLQANEMHSNARETEEMLARIAHSEDETQSARKAIDEQLRAVAGRLEAAERNQTEKNRAMSQAALQMNIAVREQAQALEQITANLSALAGRLVRLEQRAAQDGMKEAVKALHQGLSRLADQIAETAKDSASQITSLTGNLDSFAGRLAETQDKTEATTRTLDENVASLDERIRVVERTAFSSASALDHTIENLEQLRAAQESAHTERQREAAGIVQLKGICDDLNIRFDASEAQTASRIARVEDCLSKLEARLPDDAIDRRLQAVEEMLSGLIGRIEQTERSTSNTVANVEEKLSQVSAALRGAETHNHETVGQLQTAIDEASVRLGAIESKLSPADLENPAEPILDMPLFHETSSESPAAFSPPPPFPFDTQERASLERQNPAWGDSFSELPSSESPETYVAAARRAAHAAAMESERAPQASMGGFAWAFTGKGEESRQKDAGRRYLMVGSIFGVAVAAALTGVVLTRGAGVPPPHMATPSIINPISQARSFAEAKPASSAMRGASDVASDAELPASPGSSAASDNTRQNSVPGTSQLDPVPLPAAANKMKPDLPLPAGGTVAPSTSASSSAGGSGLQKLAALAGTGDSKAQLLLGLQYLGNGGAKANEAEAARWLARAAQQGEPFAQYRLATLYERGRGVPADPRQAAHWYELAAKQGNRKAMHNLAIAFAEGTGEPKNPEQAAIWFNRAASLGLADSQFNLAVLYERGMGVQQSLVEAYKWYLIAAAQGDAESKTRAEALATQVSDSDRNAAQQAAAAFRPQQPNPAANLAPTLG